jgi:hypothetical protein
MCCDNTIIVFEFSSCGLSGREKEEGTVLVVVLVKVLVT